MTAAKLESFANAFGALKETPNASNFLATCDSPSTLNPYPATTLVFPRFREASPDIQVLAEYLWLQAANYVIPLRKRKQANINGTGSSTGGDMSMATRLLRETKRAFIEYKKKYPQRASEVGELLAYIIALEYLEAAQVASKMALKTNANMPVHGLDGIHASFENGIMTLYFLESKLSASANAGVREYAESVAGFGTSRKQYLLEYEILSDLGNLDALSEDDKKTALEYLDVYGAKKSQRLERSVGVICYTEKKHFNNKLVKGKATAPAEHEKHFKSNYSAEFVHHQNAAIKHLKSKGVDVSDCEVFFVAVPDVNKLRKLFYEVMDA
jgi:hypothetical protein